MLHAFPSRTEGGPYGGLVQASDGTLFGTTTTGGSAGCGFVYKINPSGGGYTEIHSFFSSPEDQGCQSYGGLIFGSDGKLYGTTARSIFRISTAGVYEQLYSFPNGFFSPPYPYGELVEVGGTFYGTISGPEPRTGAIFALTVPPPPSATTGVATTIAARSATLNGTVNPNGLLARSSTTGPRRPTA